MYQHQNEDGTAPPSEPLSIADSNEIDACVDFFVKFLLVQPLTITLYTIPGLLIFGGRGRLAKRYLMKNRSWNRVTLIPTMILFSP